MVDRPEDPAAERSAAVDLAGGARRRRLARSTALFSLATLLSRFVGLFREVVVRRYFGVEGSINTFTVAFQVPNLVRALVADSALSAAFVPIFSEMLEKGDRARAWRVASTIFWLMLLGLGGITALFMLLAPWVMRPFGYEGAEQDLVVGLARVLFPIVVLLGLSGVIVGILNSYEQFTVPALTPVLWNLAIIAALVVGVPLLAPSAIDAAFRIYMLPQGIFAVAVATVLFPALSRLAARADTDGFRETVSSGLRQIGFLLLPASAVTAVLSVPIVRLLYERGAFGDEETTIVAQGLAAFVIGLTFNGTMLMLNRAFFSLQNAWIPTAVALGNLVLNAALDAALFRVGIWGIPLATSIVNIAGTVALLILLRRRLGRLQGRQTIDAYVRTAVASGLAAAVAFGTWYGLDQWLGRSLGAQIVSVGLGLTLAVAAFLGAARILRIQELDALLSLLRRSRPSV